ncbi:MAG: hypothetical protein HY908_20835 [Myxococcales bacterium]|nr:hypothetical protein [Myxococcales bacterium]
MSKHSDNPRIRPTPASSSAQAPSDLDLMRWLDGELDDSEAAPGQVDDVAARKLRDLELVGSLVRERADGDPRADGIADAVMAALAAEKAVPHEAKVVTLAERRADRVATGRPANDNARSIFALAALAAAAAAGLFFWGRGGGPGSEELASGDLSAPMDQIVAERAATPAPEAALLTEPVVAAQPEARPPAVEVAAVNFGARQGSVFYMGGSDAADGMTAVVWVTDDAAGGRP